MKKVCGNKFVLVKLSKPLAIALLLFSTQSLATDLFGYFEFDYGARTKDGATGSKSQPGSFDAAFVSIMMQHEVDIYKFFSEIELQHGAEMVAASDGAIDPALTYANGQIVVERAYAEMHFHPMFNVAVGKSLSPTLWKTNHYPNIVMPATEPMIVSAEVISGNYIGPMIYGSLGSGFSYNIWVNRSESGGSASQVNGGLSNYARLGYETKFDGGSVAISYLTGTTETDDGTPATYHPATGTITPAVAGTTAIHQHPYSVDLNLSYNKTLLWLEADARDGDKDAKGMYAVLSHSFDVNNNQELSPFILYDQFKESSTTKAFSNYGFGLNYKPTPNIAHKIQYYVQKKDPAQSPENNFANGDESLRYQFVYFYN
ncbi:MAG: hypothetical protein ACXWRE_04160 [Pseudobdellovibrionaceae bacterium]